MTVKLVNFIFLPYPIDSLTMLTVIESRKLHDGRSLGNHLSGSSPYSYNKEKLSYEERRNKLEQNSDGINENRTFDSSLVLILLLTIISHHTGII